MFVQVVGEEGYDFALYGLGLSYGLTSSLTYNQYINNKELKDRLRKVAAKLSSKDGGHNKFLEQITINVIVDAPRYWWSQMDTYRIGISKSSESTMHTIMKNPFSDSDFEKLPDDGPISIELIERLEYLRKNKDFRQLKRELPESFLQKRAIKLSYKTLRNIVQQRHNHKLSEWQIFISEMLKQIEHPEYIKHEID